MTDTVSIRDLRVSAVIGVYDWERETEQTLVFAVDMASDVAAAAVGDDIAAALDYSAVAQTVRSVVTEGRFQLIETAAERVAERLRDDYRLSWLRVEVAKPLPGEGYTAAVAIERGSRLRLAPRTNWPYNTMPCRMWPGHGVADVSFHFRPLSCQDE